MRAASSAWVGSTPASAAASVSRARVCAIASDCPAAKLAETSSAPSVCDSSASRSRPHIPATRSRQPRKLSEPFEGESAHGGGMFFAFGDLILEEEFNSFNFNKAFLFSTSMKNQRIKS